MLSINDLKNGTIIILDNDPFLILSIKHQHLGRGGASVTAKIRNLRTGQVFDRTFKPSDEFEEAEVEKIKSRFLYENRGICCFDEINNPKNRFSFPRNDLGDSADFLKSNLEVSAIKFNGKIIGIELPIKVGYKVIEAPPSLRGNTASGGAKMVAIESGAKISVPLFIEEGDIVRVNTQTGLYEKRI